MSTTPSVPQPADDELGESLLERRARRIAGPTVEAPVRLDVIGSSPLYIACGDPDRQAP
jgi:hypothetical protein